MIGLRIIMLFCLSCLAWSYPFDQYKKGEVELANKKKVKIIIAMSSKEKTLGLSGTKQEQFKDDEGMLFFYEADEDKGFWMPDTYFDLDLFYLDKNFEVLKIDRQVPHHPGLKEPPTIKRLNPVFCRHVMEMKSSSPLSKSIRPGDKLKWLPK